MRSLLVASLFALVAGCGTPRYARPAQSGIDPGLAARSTQWENARPPDPPPADVSRPSS